MSAKQHIWPAYVDMMTVLLLVYILVSALLSVIISMAELDPAHEEQKTTAMSQQGHQKEQPDDQPDDQPDMPVIRMQAQRQLYADRAGDLAIRLGDEKDDYKKETDIARIKQWIAGYQGLRGKYEVGVFLHDDGTRTSGNLLRRQVILYYSLLSTMKAGGVPFSDILNRNATPSEDYESVIKMRFTPCENEPCLPAEEGK